MPQGVPGVGRWGDVGGQARRGMGGLRLWGASPVLPRDMSAKWFPVYVSNLRPVWCFRQLCARFKTSPKDLPGLITRAARNKHDDGTDHFARPTRPWRPRMHQPEHRKRRTAKEEHPPQATGCMSHAQGATLTLGGLARPASCAMHSPTAPNATSVAVVQSNKVYPTPSASQRMASFGGASDKRFPLGLAAHHCPHLSSEAAKRLM